MRLKTRIPIVLKAFEDEYVRKTFLMRCEQFNPYTMEKFTHYFHSIEPYWSKNPDLRLTQVLINLGIIDNLSGFWFNTEEDDWLVENGFLKPRDICFWGSDYDKDIKPLSSTKYTLIKDLDTEHIENILNVIRGNSNYKKYLEDELEYRKEIEQKRKLKIGDRVTKTKGYQFIGEVRSVFTNSYGDTRLVVEHEDSKTENSGGMLHIFNEKQLEKV